MYTGESTLNELPAKLQELLVKENSILSRTKASNWFERANHRKWERKHRAQKKLRTNRWRWVTVTGSRKICINSKKRVRQQRKCLYSLRLYWICGGRFSRYFWGVWNTCHNMRKWKEWKFCIKIYLCLLFSSYQSASAPIFVQTFYGAWSLHNKNDDVN